MDTNAWEFAREKVCPGQNVRNWTVAKGYVGEDFVVRGVEQDTLSVELPSGRTLSVNARDFRLVGQQWADYVAGRVQRHALRDVSQRTKYVISILHQLGYPTGR
jgi:hypothetical protein